MKSYGPRMARSRLYGVPAICRFFLSLTPLFIRIRTVSHHGILRNRHGYSQHGDYVFGWQGDSLQRAMDARCNGAVCGQLEMQSSESAMKCIKSRTVKEEIDGCKFTFLLRRPIS